MADKTVSIRTTFVDDFLNPLKRSEKALIKFGEVGVRVTRRLLQPLRRLTRVFTTLSTIVGGISLAGFAIGVRNTVRELTKISRQADALRLSASLFNDLAGAAERVGGSAESMQTALQRSSAAVDEFRRTGGGPAAAALSQLRIRFSNADGSARRFEDVLNDIADGLARVRNEQRRMELGRSIFQTDNPLVLGILGGGSDEIARFREEQQALGASLTDAEIERIARFGRAIDAVALAFTGLRQRVASAIAPIGREIAVKFAAAIKIVPEVLGRLVDLINTALGPDGPLATAAKDKLDRMFVAFVELGGTIVTEGVRLLVAVAVAAVDNALTVLAPQIIPRVTVFLNDVILGAVQSLHGALSHVFDGTILGTIFGNFSDFANLQRDVVRKALNDVFAIDSPSEVAEKLSGGFANAAGVFEESVERVGESARELFGAIDEGTGIFDVFQQSVIEVQGVLDRTFGEQGRTQTIGAFSQTVDAIGRGFSRVADQIRTAGQLGEQIGGALANGVRSFASAIVDGIQGIESFGDAFKRVASNILRQISELIIEFLLLRTISRIGQSFFGSSLATGGVVTGGVRGLAAGGVVGAGIATALAFPVPAFASGGVIPAIPGGQLFRAGEAGDPEGVLPLTRTRGGDLGVRAEGMAPSISIAVTVNMQGGAASSDAEAKRLGTVAGREVAAQVLDAIDRSMTLRRKFHNMPGASG